MGLISIRRLQACLGAVAVMVLGAPAAAQAQDTLAEALAPLYHVQTGTWEYTGTAGGPHLFALVASRYESDASNKQALAGFFDTSTFGGVVFEHDYDGRQDVGKYQVTGAVDPVGLAPPAPLAAFLQANIDRTRATTVFSISGTIGGVPFAGSTPPIVNPLYDPF